MGQMKLFTFAGLIAATVLLGVSPNVAAKDLNTGNYWHSECNGEAMEGKYACMILVKGFVHGTSSQAYHTKAQSKQHCLPSGVEYRQLRDVFSKHLADNPQKRHMHVAFLLDESLSKAFPCQ